MLRARCRLYALGLLLLLSSLCQAQAGGPQTAMLKQRVTWGTLPGALSCTIALYRDHAVDRQPRLVFTIERDEQRKEAYTIEWQAKRAVAQGSWYLVYQFRDGHAGSGAVLAQAAQQITLRADGSGAVPVTQAGGIAAVEVVAGQRLLAGWAKPLDYQVRDQAGAVLAVDPAKVQWQVQGGTDLLQFQGDTVRPLRTGTARVSLIVGGVTGPGTDVSVISPFAATRYTFEEDLGHKTLLNSPPLRYPCELALDAAGNLYVADANSQRIYKYDKDGKLLTSWGGPGTREGEFLGWMDLALDGNGSLYVTDAGNHRVQQFTTDGKFLKQWGTQGAGNGQFNFPCGVAVDRTGHVYICDTENHRIQVFSADGVFERAFGKEGCYAGMLVAPRDIAVTADGILFIADALNLCIAKYDNTGKYISQWTVAHNPGPRYATPHSLALDVQGNVYVTDDLHSLQKYAPDGKLLARWGGREAVKDLFTDPYGVAVDPNGQILVADALKRVQALDANGKPQRSIPLADTDPQRGMASGFAIMPRVPKDILLVADAPNDRILQFNSGNLTYEEEWGRSGIKPGQFRHPSGISRKEGGEIVVADTGNYRVQRFNEYGDFLSEWRLQRGDTEPIGIPVGIAADDYGTIYVSNASCHRVEKYNKDGKFLAQWGKQGAGDGEFNLPGAIALDRTGNLYIADTRNYRVVKCAPNGKVLAHWGMQGTGNGEFAAITGIACDKQGVFVIDATGRTQLFSPDGTFIASFSATNQPGDPSLLLYGLAIHSNGTVYTFHPGQRTVCETSADAASQCSFSIDTRAGGFSGLGSPCIDSRGYIYTISAGGRAIRKYSANGGVVETWGMMQKQMKFDHLIGVIAVDRNDNLYAVHRQGDPRLAVFDPQGQPIKQYSLVDKKYYGIYGVVVDTEGNFYISYIAAPAAEAIDKYSPKGELLLSWKPQDTDPKRLKDVEGITLGDDGILSIVHHDGRVSKWTSDGKYLTDWPISNQPLAATDSIATDTNGRYYTAAFFSGLCYINQPDGTQVKVFGGEGSQYGKLIHPTRITASTDGMLYISALGQIHKFTTDGTFITRWGLLESNETPRYHPSRISVSKAGNIFITDSAYGQIIVLDATGKLQRAFAGYGGKKQNGCFEYGGTLWISTDVSENIVVYDSTGYPGRNQAFTSDGKWLWVWETDQNSARNSIMTLDYAGNVYLNEFDGTSFKHRICKYGPNGRMITAWDPTQGVGFEDTYGYTIKRMGVDKNGILSVLWDDRITQYTTAGKYLRQWPLPKDSTSYDLAVDVEGHVYLCSAMVKYTPEGVEMAKLVGDRPGSAAYGNIIARSGISLGADGSIYLVDATSRIQKLVPAP